MRSLHRVGSSTGLVVLTRLVVTFAVLCALVSAPATTGAAPGASHVFLLGDSIFAAMAPEYTNAAQRVIGANDWAVTLDAAPGRTTAQGIDVVRARRSELGDIVVVQLGNNDGGNRAIYTERVLTMMDELRDVPLVYWTTMRSTRPDNAVANSVIRDIARTRTNMRILDWDAHSLSQRSWFGTDDLHLTADGANAFARLILQTIDDAPLPDCGADTNPPSAPNDDAVGGYWLLDSTGRIWPFGRAVSYGDLTSRGVAGRPVSMQATASGLGYWIVTEAGAVHGFGDALVSGDMSTTRLNGAVRRIEAAAAHTGYWLVGADGGVFTFGDAAFHGSMGGQRINAPVISLAGTASGAGYWLVAADGGVFSFGDAAFHGSTGSMRLNRPIVSMTVAPSGSGYWLYGGDGGVFTFGDASFHGSVPGLGLCDAPRTVAMRASGTGLGYYVAAADGRVFAFGDAPSLGDRPAMTGGAAVVDMAVMR
jgi:lysophospholipase L1-like esterase